MVRPWEGGKRGTSERKRRSDGYKREGGRKGVEDSDVEEGRRYGSKLGGKRKKRRDLYKEGRKDKGQRPRKERLGGK